MTANRLKRCFWTTVGVLGVAVATSVGYGTARAQGTCPGEDACYAASGCSACKNMNCNSLSCPDPTEEGSNCYVCAGG
jgi:hypothetical protein